MWGADVRREREGAVVQYFFSIHEEGEQIKLGGVTANVGSGSEGYWFLRHPRDGGTSITKTRQNWEKSTGDNEQGCRRERGKGERRSEPEAQARSSTPLSIKKTEEEIFWEARAGPREGLTERFHRGEVWTARRLGLERGENRRGKKRLRRRGGGWLLNRELGAQPEHVAFYLGNLISTCHRLEGRNERNDERGPKSQEKEGL